MTWRPRPRRRADAVDLDRLDAEPPLVDGRPGDGQGHAVLDHRTRSRRASWLVSTRRASAGSWPPR